MCGIVGMVTDQVITRPILNTAINTLHHRGPDGVGCWLSEDGGVGLAHARLSIIGVENGQQPIVSEDG